MSRTRRRLPWWILFVAFLLVPLVEIWAILQVGQLIGAWWTVGLLVADSIFGAWLVRREGRRAWQALSAALASGRMPSRELSDGALILIGGTLMLTPGFVTDAVGILLILPLTRPLFRRMLQQVVARRLLSTTTGGLPADAFRTAQRPGHRSGPVVQGEVVDD